jgi:hypothetical protein
MNIEQLKKLCGVCDNEHSYSDAVCEKSLSACGACGEWSHPNSHNCSEEQGFSCCSCGYQFFQNEGVTIEEGRHLEFVCSECYGGNN